MKGDFEICVERAKSNLVFPVVATMYAVTKGYGCASIEEMCIGKSKLHEVAQVSLLSNWLLFS